MSATPKALRRAKNYLYYARNILEWRSARSLFASLQAIRLFRTIKGHSMLSVERRVALYRLALQVERAGLPGDFVECGVWQGGSAAILAFVLKRSAQQRRLWLFDSFAGLPQPGLHDGSVAHERYRPGWCQGDVDTVRRLLRRTCAQESRIHIVPGWFQDTFVGVQVPQISLLHIDADWYQSVKLCLEKFYDAVVPGGCVVLDDYGHWEGCRKATNEFLTGRDLSVSVRSIDATGHYFQKP